MSIRAKKRKDPEKRKQQPTEKKEY